MPEQPKWFFETSKNTFSGANDPIYETFRAHPYYSIVRESIQNSMDVLLDNEKPVVVKFETITINQVEHPQLFSLRKHIESCLDFHKGNKQAEDLYSGMLKYLDENPAIKILKVSDYNTKGMEYEQDNHLCPFTSFMGEGISSKSAGAGGSFGFGKGAYFVPSELRTILVSTKTDNDEICFQGRTRLASHEIDSEIRSKDGVFKIDEDSPITNMDDVSPIFRRTERGTDVFILGMSDDPKCGEEMVRSVLNNFWLAIHEDRLDVIIKTDDVNVEFDETNLEQIMDEYFPDEVEHGTIGDIYQWNPKAYYKAVKYKEQSNDYLYFEKHLESIGLVRMYIYRNDGLQNRISFMRKPAMTVYKIGRSLLSGYAATVVCDNEQGNEILRQMENAAHNQWRAENVRYKAKEEMQVYYDARFQLNEFVKDTLKSVSGVDNSTRMDVAGLADWLTIPEELLNSEEAFSGNASSTTAGSPSNDNSGDETGLVTTIGDKISLNYKPPAQSNMSGSAQESDGEELVDIGPDNVNETDNPNPEPSPFPSDQLVNGSNNGDGNALVPIPIKFRIAAQTQDEEMVHNLILQSDSVFSDVQLVLKTGTDNGDELELNVLETNEGSAMGNVIRNVNLVEGKNIIQIKFDDNLKHTLKLAAYEAQ